MFELCGRPELHVLGTVNGVPGENFKPDHIFAFTQKSCRYPQIFCPSSSGITLQVIMFERPHPRRMQYMSLNPISLALEEKVALAGAGEVDDTAEETKERQRKAELVEKLKLHSVSRPVPTEKERSLQTIIDQVNCSYDMMMLLKENVSLINSRRRRRTLSVSERVVESATSLWRTILSLLVRTAKFLWPFVKRCFIVVVLLWRLVAETILKVLEWRLRPELAALKDISATGEKSHLFPFISATKDVAVPIFCFFLLFQNRPIYTFLSLSAAVRYPSSAILLLANPVHNVAQAKGGLGQCHHLSPGLYPLLQ